MIDWIFLHSSNEFHQRTKKNSVSLEEKQSQISILGTHTHKTVLKYLHYGQSHNPLLDLEKKNRTSQEKDEQAQAAQSDKEGLTADCRGSAPEEQGDQPAGGPGQQCGCTE